MKNASPIDQFTDRLAFFLSPDAYTPSAADAPTVSSGGTVTAANWRKMQLQGCVFLPCAGYTISSYSGYIGKGAYFWLPVKYDNYNSYVMQFSFNSKSLNTNAYMTNSASASVRLVHTL